MLFWAQAENKHLSLRFDLAPDLPHHVLGDESKLRQVLSNLLSNAIKFTSKGRVVLRAFVTPSSHSPSLSIPFHLCFQVEDTGCGIAEGEMEKLFQPFVQTTGGSQSGSGKGLGLAISHEFVQLMGGKLEVKSTEKEGSVFHFNIMVNLLENTQIADATSQISTLDFSHNLHHEIKINQYFQSMSPEWVNNLHQAAVEVDADRIFRLIEQIPNQYQALTDRLTKLTQNYDFDAIIALSRENNGV